MYGISVFSKCVVSINNRYYSSGSSKKLLEILANMPKANSARIDSAQRQRQHISKKGEKYGPSTVYLQVLGSGAKGAPNTLYLFTDQKRYMFNCGECTQRLAHEHKVKLSKLDHIFITSKTWRNIGGLPGMSLTLQDVGVPNITLHGPDGLDELYNATKRFVIMKDMNVTMARSSPSEDFEDNVMTVKYVLLGPVSHVLGTQALKQYSTLKKATPEFSTDKEFEEFIHDDTDYYGGNKSNMHKEKFKHKPHTERVDFMKHKAEKFLQTLRSHTDCSVAYICTLKKRLGTLDLAKCVEAGVKPGPLLGQLKSGIDVVLPNGNLVRSKDVKTPDDPGPVFIVLDVPDPSYLQESDFQAHFDKETNPRENIPVLIVHFTPPHVFQHPTYSAFIAKFGATTQHLILNTKNSCLGSEAVHRTQHKLHLLDPDIFPLLRDVSVPAVWNAQSSLPKADSPVRLKCLEELKNKIAFAQFQNIINLEGSCKGDAQLPQETGGSTKLDLLPGRTLTMYHLRPKKQIDRSAEPKLHVQEYIQETMDVDGFASSLEQFRHLVDGIKYAKSDSLDYPKIVFLGTGSCIPSKTRNTSAIVLQIDEKHSMLLDCGEGTYGQLVRFYGPKKVNAFLRTLKAIYISHLHADHHIGLIGVLQGRREAFKDTPDEHHVPAYLLAPGQIVTWLTVYDHQFESIKDNYTLIPNQCLLHDADAPHPSLTSAALSAMGVHAVRTCRVAHCPNAFGVAVHIRGQKITYSGDTLPCEDLVKLGENSSLLIHEATMEDELADEARTKMHSTTTQAIDVGRQMNARFTVLTHFSQRYARLPRLNANILNNNRTVGIAFDNMQITMNDLQLLPHMYAPLQLMFADHCVEMELKAAHRQLREERNASPSDSPTTKRLRDHREHTPHSGIYGSRSSHLSPKRRASPCPDIHSTYQSVYKNAPISRLKQEPRGRTPLDLNRQMNHSRSPSYASSISSNSTRGPTRLTRGRTSDPLDMANRQQLHSRSPSYASSISSNSTRSPPCLRQPGMGRIGGTSTKSILSPSAQSTPQPLRSQPKQLSWTRSSACYSTGGVPCRSYLELNVGVKSRLEPGAATRSSQLRQAANKQPRSRSCSLSARSKRNSSSERPPCGTDSTLSRPRFVLNPKPTVNDYQTVKQQSPKLPRSRVSSVSPNPKRRLSTATVDKTNELGTGLLKPSEMSADSSKHQISNESPTLHNQPPTSAEVPDIMEKNGNNVSPLPKPQEAHHDTTGKRLKSALSNRTFKKEVSRPPLCTNTALVHHQPRPDPVSGDNEMHLTTGAAKSLQDSKTHGAKKSHIPEPNVKHPNRGDKSKPQIDTVKKQIFGNSMEGNANDRMRTKLGTRANMPSPSTKTTVMHSSIKTYKPQLEDIKSSYLLLNQNRQAASFKPGFGKSRVSTNTIRVARRDSKSHLPKIPKPTPLNEALRKKQLMEARKKFSSRRFMYDSKYDKIEGLNWISWK